MTLAVVLPFWLDRSPLEALEIAGHADRLGYPELWIGEMMTFDAFALGAALARTTDRVRLVVGPVAIGVRDPVALALGIASVSLLGNRPAHLALGASTPTVVASWHGRSWRHTTEHMRETVVALRQILAGERCDFSGAHVRCEGFRLAAGAQQTALFIAAFGVQMLRTAAEVADRVVVNLLTPGQVKRVRGQIDQAAQAIGRTPPPLVAWVPVALDPSAEAIAQLRRQLVVYLAPPGYGEMFTEAGFGDVVRLARSGVPAREVLGAIPDALIEAVCAAGDAPRVRAAIAAYGAAGADVVGIVPVTAGDPGGIRVLRALADGL